MTTSELGNRQRGDLGGPLHPPLQPTRMTIAAEDEAASSRSGQHLLWMLTNLLARQVDEISQITFEINPDVTVLDRVSPLVADGVPLTTALKAGAAQINPLLGAPQNSAPELRIQIGAPASLPGEPLHTLYVSATSWRGYIGTQQTPWTGDMDGNPVGPYVAACLAAAEVFKFVRGVQPDYGTSPGGLWYDAWHMRRGDQGEAGPSLPAVVQGLSAVVAGIGAVGSALLHTLYAVPGLHADIIAVDHDPKGIEITNLNRYTLFSQADLGRPKATQAALKLAGTGLEITPRDRLWQQWTVEQPGEARELVLSCVDNNVARHAIQSSMPGVILSASTMDLRAQVIGFERLPGAACLRCRNPPEDRSPDETVIQTLRACDPATRASFAAEQGIRSADLEQFLEDPQAHCGLISGETLQRFSQPGAAEDHWSVGFVSAMAGVMLAAEYLKRTLRPEAPGLSGQTNMARFQFWHPESSVNAVCHWPAAADCTCTLPQFLAAVTAHPYRRGQGTSRFGPASPSADNLPH